MPTPPVRARRARAAVAIGAVLAILAAGGCAASDAGTAGASGSAPPASPGDGRPAGPTALPDGPKFPQALAARRRDGETRPGATPRPPGSSPAPGPAGRVVVIDPGHNGGNGSHPEIINRLVDAGGVTKPCDTTGTQTAQGYAEHAYAWDVSLRLAALLRARGVTVRLTRTGDTGVGPCITERAAIGNTAGADAAISVHADGGPEGGYGFHVIEPGLVSGLTDRIVAPSHRLALDVRAAFARVQPYATYVAGSGLDTRTDLGGLNLSKVPKIFIECGNMRNSRDAARLSSASFRQSAAAALATGLISYLTR